jgi:hypothetical protein
MAVQTQEVSQSAHLRGDQLQHRRSGRLLRAWTSARASCELSTTSASATGHHDLLREEELVDLSALLPRLDDAEPDGIFAVGRDRLADSLGVDFFAVGRGRPDAFALDAVFLAAGRGADD